MDAPIRPKEALYHQTETRRVEESFEEGKRLKKLLDDAKFKDDELLREPRAKIQAVIELTRRTEEIHQINKLIMETWNVERSKEQEVKEIYGMTINEINNILSECVVYRSVLEDYLNFNSEPIYQNLPRSTPINLSEIKRNNSPSPESIDGAFYTKDHLRETSLIRQTMGGIRYSSDNKLEVIKKELILSGSQMDSKNKVIRITKEGTYCFLMSVQWNLLEHERIFFKILEILGTYGVKLIICTYRDSTSAFYYNEAIPMEKTSSANLYSVVRELMRDEFKEKPSISPLYVDIYGENYELLASIEDNNYNSLIVHKYKSS